jgi:hypothetical protein
VPRSFALHLADSAVRVLAVVRVVLAASTDAAPQESEQTAALLVVQRPHGEPTRGVEARRPDENMWGRSQSMGRLESLGNSSRRVRRISARGRSRKGRSGKGGREFGVSSDFVLVCKQT